MLRALSSTKPSSRVTSTNRRTFLVFIIYLAMTTPGRPPLEPSRPAQAEPTEGHHIHRAAELKSRHKGIHPKRPKPRQSSCSLETSKVSQIQSIRNSTRQARRPSA